MSNKSLPYHIAVVTNILRVWGGGGGGKGWGEFVYITYFHTAHMFSFRQLLSDLNSYLM